MSPAEVDREGPASGNPSSAPDVIDLWALRLHECHEQRHDAWVRCLDDEERAFASRLGPGERAARFVARRAMMRHILARYAQCSPSSLQFRAGPYGKPALVNEGVGSIPHFNLSHTGDLAVLAVTWSGDVGVDVETLTPIRENVAALFSRTEQDHFAALPEPRATEALYRSWTCKEAVLKLLGTGLAFPIEDIEISDPHHPPALLRLGTDRDGASRIHLKTFAIEDAVGAVATRATEIALAYKTWSD